MKAENNPTKTTKMSILLSRLSLSQRITFIIIVPILGLCVFGFVTVSDHIEKTQDIEREIASVTELTELGTIIAGAIHEWQKERGRSAGYLGSKGQKFSNEIIDQYRASDSAMEDLSKELARRDFAHQPSEFHSALSESLNLMRNIPAWRRDVLDQKVSGGEAVGRYTSLITSFLEVIDTSAKLTEKSQISLLLVSYSNFLRAKENMGIERAVLSNAFGADAFKADFYRRYCTVLANQTAYLASFKAFAVPEHWEFYIKTLKGDAVDKVDAFEKLAFEKADTGDFGVNPGDWFTQITKKIDLMKIVEDHIAETVKSSSEKTQATNESKFQYLIGTAALIVIFSLAVSYYVASSTSNSLRTTVKDLNLSIDEVANASGQVSQSSIDMANAATEQSATLSETNEILSKITEATKTNGELADNANLITAEARKMADEGLDEMNTLQSAMDEIRNSSDEISAIIKTIDEIAFQTNILALNAAVEAARAGESGAGFAVVADEVRSLAQRSAQAAADTTQKIEDSVTRARNGTNITSAVGSVLERIVSKVREVDEVVTKIDDASKYQLSAIVEIQSAVKTQEDVVMGLSASTEETASAAEELYAQTTSMQSAIKDLAIQAGAKPNQKVLRRPEGNEDRSRQALQRTESYPISNSTANESAWN